MASEGIFFNPSSLLIKLFELDLFGVSGNHIPGIGNIIEFDKECQGNQIFLSSDHAAFPLHLLLRW